MHTPSLTFEPWGQSNRSEITCSEVRWLVWFLHGSQEPYVERCSQSWEEEQKEGPITDLMERWLEVANAWHVMLEMLKFNDSVTSLLLLIVILIWRCHFFFFFNIVSFWFIRYSKVSTLRPFYMCFPFPITIFKEKEKSGVVGKGMIVLWMFHNINCNYKWIKMYNIKNDREIFTCTHTYC